MVESLVILRCAMSQGIRRVQQQGGDQRHGGDGVLAAASGSTLFSGTRHPWEQAFALELSRRHHDPRDMQHFALTSRDQLQRACDRPVREWPNSLLHTCTRRTKEHLALLETELAKPDVSDVVAARKRREREDAIARYAEARKRKQDMFARMVVWQAMHGKSVPASVLETLRTREFIDTAQKYSGKPYHPTMYHQEELLLSALACPDWKKWLTPDRVAKLVEDWYGDFAGKHAISSSYVKDKVRMSRVLGFLDALLSLYPKMGQSARLQGLLTPYLEKVHAFWGATPLAAAVLPMVRYISRQLRRKPTDLDYQPTRPYFQKWLRKLHTSLGFTESHADAAYATEFIKWVEYIADIHDRPFPG